MGLTHDTYGTHPRLIWDSDSSLGKTKTKTQYLPYITTDRFLGERSSQQCWIFSQFPKLENRLTILNWNQIKTHQPFTSLLVSSAVLPHHLGLQHSAEYQNMHLFGQFDWAEDLCC